MLPPTRHFNEQQSNILAGGVLELACIQYMECENGTWRALFRISEKCLGSDSFRKTSSAIKKSHHGPFLCSFLYLPSQQSRMFQSHRSPALLQSSASWVVHVGMPLMAVVKATYTRSQANAWTNIWTMLSMGKFSYSKSTKLFVLNKSCIQVLFSKHSKYRCILHAILVDDIVHIQWDGPYTLRIHWAISYRFVWEYFMVFAQ